MSIQARSEKIFNKTIDEIVELSSKTGWDWYALRLLPSDDELLYDSDYAVLFELLDSYNKVTEFAKRLGISAEAIEMRENIARIAKGSFIETRRYFNNYFWMVR